MTVVANSEIRFFSSTAQGNASYIDRAYAVHRDDGLFGGT